MPPRGESATEGLALLQRGLEVIKFSRTGKPSVTTVRLDEAELTLSWQPRMGLGKLKAKPGKRSIETAGIQSVDIGRDSAAFQQAPTKSRGAAHLSLSLVLKASYAAEGRETLDLCCADEEEFGCLVAAFRALIDECYRAAAAKNEAAAAALRPWGAGSVVITSPPAAVPPKPACPAPDDGGTDSASVSAQPAQTDDGLETPPTVLAPASSAEAVATDDSQEPSSASPAGEAGGPCKDSPLTFTGADEANAAAAARRIAALEARVRELEMTEAQPERRDSSVYLARRDSGKGPREDGTITADGSEVVTVAAEDDEEDQNEEDKEEALKPVEPVKVGDTASSPKGTRRLVQLEGPEVPGDGGFERALDSDTDSGGEDAAIIAGDLFRSVTPPNADGAASAEEAADALFATISDGDGDDDDEKQATLRPTNPFGSAGAFKTSSGGNPFAEAATSTEAGPSDGVASAALAADALFASLSGGEGAGNGSIASTSANPFETVDASSTPSDQVDRVLKATEESEDFVAALMREIDEDIR